MIKRQFKLCKRFVKMLRCEFYSFYKGIEDLESSADERALVGAMRLGEVNTLVSIINAKSGRAAQSSLHSPQKLPCLLCPACSC